MVGVLDVVLLFALLFFTLDFHFLFEVCGAPVSKPLFRESYFFREAFHSKVKIVFADIGDSNLIPILFQRVLDVVLMSLQRGSKVDPMLFESGFITVPTWFQWGLNVVLLGLKCGFIRV